MDFEKKPVALFFHGFQLYEELAEKAATNEMKMMHCSRKIVIQKLSWMIFNSLLNVR